MPVYIRFVMWLVVVFSFYLRKMHLRKLFALVLELIP